MKDIKITLKTLSTSWLTWGKELWKPYLLLATLFSIFAYAFMRICATTLLPLWMLSHETDNWNFILSVIALDLPWAIILTVTLTGTIVASISAHKKMKAFVTQFDKKELGKSRRNVLTANVVVMLMTANLVAFLPSVVIFISYNAASMSGMMLDNIATPKWAHVMMILCTFIGMLFCEIIATFARLCYREIKETRNENTEIGETNNEDAIETAPAETSYQAK